MERVIVRGPGFCAVTEDGVLVEFLRRDASQGGDILGGTVERMMPGIGGAFVSIGMPSTAEAVSCVAQRTTLMPSYSPMTEPGCCKE